MGGGGGKRKTNEKTGRSVNSEDDLCVCVYVCVCDCLDTATKYTCDNTKHRPVGSKQVGGEG